MHKQHSLPILQELKQEVREADWRLVRQCRHWSEAVRLCMSLSRVYRSDSVWSELLGIDKTSFNLMKNADRNDRGRSMSADQIADLELLAGNTAVSQYMEAKRNGLLVDKQAQIAALEAELKALKAS